MKKNAGGFFWGVLAGAATVALAAAAALTLSFRSSHDNGDSWEAPARRKGKSAPAGRKGARRQGKK
jgi:uncharacterized membrane protein YdjX (TVP38/TMEM64 family)